MLVEARYIWHLHVEQKDIKHTGKELKKIDNRFQY